jgi:Ca-activated chloride channel homolog
LILNKSLNYQFQYKDFYWLFCGIIFFLLLFISLLLWKKKTIRKIGDKALVKALIKNYSGKLFTLKFIFLSLAFAAGVMAAMNPRKPGAADNSSKKGIDVVIALDVSKSMLAVDLQPNRLERAKQLINKLIDKMPDDRIALVVFAGKAYMQMPLTTDHGAAKLFVSSASPNAIAQQGTVLKDAMEMSSLAFNEKERRFKSVILISDGEDHDEDGEKTAVEMAERGVMINTVGVGSLEGSPIIDPATNDYKKDLMGQTVISKLNEESLKTIANKTNGIYVRLENSDGAINLLQQQLSQIERKAFTDVSLLNYTNYFMWFTLGMLVLLFTELFIPERRSLKQPEKTVAA